MSDWKRSNTSLFVRHRAFTEFVWFAYRLRSLRLISKRTLKHVINTAEVAFLGGRLQKAFPDKDM